MSAAKNHQRARGRLRRELEAQGVPSVEIERRVYALALRQKARRGGADPDPEPPAVAPRAEQLEAAARRAGVPVHEFDAHVDAFHARTRPDDRGYKPDTPDPLARGAARVTGATLRAARRKHATTRYELNQQEHRS